MTKIGLLFTALGAALVIGTLLAQPAQAQVRVFVAAHGSDANPCSFALPCRTFQHAHDTVAAGGEIDVLDPAGYGAVIISKAISIQGHGFSGISVPSGGTGIIINAGGADKVSLNGLLIEGATLGQMGIVFNTGQSLTIENCVVRNVTGDGIQFLPQAHHSKLSIMRTLLADNGGSGVFVNPQPTTNVPQPFQWNYFSQVEALNNGGDGIFVSVGSSHTIPVAHIVDSNALFNGSIGFEFLGGGEALLVRSSVSGNNIGVSAGLSAIVTMTDVRSGPNRTADYAVTSNTSEIRSYGDNVGGPLMGGSFTVLSKE